MPVAWPGARICVGVLALYAARRWLVRTLGQAVEHPRLLGGGLHPLVLPRRRLVDVDLVDDRRQLAVFVGAEGDALDRLGPVADAG